jgi:hypothetical protein
MNKRWKNGSKRTSWGRLYIWVVWSTRPLLAFSHSQPSSRHVIAAVRTTLPRSQGTMSWIQIAEKRRMGDILIHNKKNSKSRRFFSLTQAPTNSWPSSSGLRGHRRTYLTNLERAWSANFKMVLLRPLGPELNGQDPFQICGRLCQTRKTPTLDGRPSSAYYSYSCTKLVTPIYLLH